MVPTDSQNTTKIKQGDKVTLLSNNAIQYHLQEYADNPLTFDRVPMWLEEAVANGTIRPEFRSEDYWYLIVKTPDGDLSVSPGDWIINNDGKIKVECTKCTI